MESITGPLSYGNSHVGCEPWSKLLTRALYGGLYGIRSFEHSLLGFMTGVWTIAHMGALASGAAWRCSGCRVGGRPISSTVSIQDGRAMLGMYVGFYLIRRFYSGPSKVFVYHPSLFTRNIDSSSCPCTSFSRALLLRLIICGAMVMLMQAGFAMVELAPQCQDTVLLSGPLSWRQRLRRSSCQRRPCSEPQPAIARKPTVLGMLSSP